MNELLDRKALLAENRAQRLSTLSAKSLAPPRRAQIARSAAILPTPALRPPAAPPSATPRAAHAHCAFRGTSSRRRPPPPPLSPERRSSRPRPNRDAPPRHRSRASSTQQHVATHDRRGHEAGPRPGDRELAAAGGARAVKSLDAEKAAQRAPGLAFRSAASAHHSSFQRHLQTRTRPPALPRLYSDSVPPRSAVGLKGGGHCCRSEDIFRLSG